MIVILIPSVIFTLYHLPVVNCRCGEASLVRRGRSLITIDASSYPNPNGSNSDIEVSEIESFETDYDVDGVSGRIIGGTYAVYGEFPWMVSLQERRGSTWVHSCGASVIAPGWLLTAAHCKAGFRRQGRALAGCLKRTASAGCQQTAINYNDFVVHPNYNSRSMKNDIALIRLRVPYQLVSEGKPLNIICMPANSNVADGLAVVSGWGLTRNEGYASMNLKRVNVNVVPRAICNNRYGNIDSGTQVCAGYLKGGKDSCQGDSGGPLMRWSPSGKSWVQIGIVSFGDVCGMKGSPAVYTKVAAYNSWINQYVRQ